MGLTFSFGNFMRVGDASLEWTFFFWHPWIFMLLAPAVGMKLWADEQRTGTIELLGTFPLSTWSAIIGKFLAAATVWLSRCCSPSPSSSPSTTSASPTTARSSPATSAVSSSAAPSSPSPCWSPPAPATRSSA
jgi:hypothetical protein